MTSPERRFADLFAHTQHALLAYAVRRVPIPEDAADVVAETFLVAWRRIDEVPVGDDARPWLYGVARRVLANQRRGDLRRSELAERLRIELGRLAPAQRMLPPGLQEAFDGLPENDRELLRLVAWEELSHAEIAATLGISRAAVRVRLYRARQRLRGSVEASGSAEPGMRRRPRVRQVPGEIAAATSDTQEWR